MSRGQARHFAIACLSVCLGLAGAVVGLVVASAEPGSAVSGVVTRQDGQPAAGAWVRVRTTSNLTFAAADGSFTLSGLEVGEVVTVTAWIPGYKTGWAVATAPAENLAILVRPYDTRDDSSYAWNTSYADPANPVLGCGHCMSPSFDEWQHTAHAASGTNPRFFSLYNGTDLTGTVTLAPGYRLDFPGTAGNCATCHAPGAAYDAPFTTDMNTLGPVEREGVFCEFCHKVGAVYLNPATGRPYDNAPGTISMRLYRPFPGDQLFLGSLDDITRRVSYLPLEKQSQFCAPCHQFSFWGTPIYQSFREWQESAYPAQGIECQTCHMPPGSSPYFVLPEKGGLARDPARLASHLDLGIKDPAFMQSSLAMSVETQAINEHLVVRVKLENIGAGHHFPTDHPGRHLILTVRARDPKGFPLAQISGETVPPYGGAQASLPGKLYAKILRDALTGTFPVVSYWKQTFIDRDNRIPALGWDSSVYAFALPARGGRITVQVEVLFRRTFQGEMDRRGWQEADILLNTATVQVLAVQAEEIFLPLVVR